MKLNFKFKEGDRIRFIDQSDKDMGRNGVKYGGVYTVERNIRPVNSTNREPSLVALKEAPGWLIPESKFEIANGITRAIKRMLKFKKLRRQPTRGLYR